MMSDTDPPPSPVACPSRRHLLVSASGAVGALCLAQAASATPEQADEAIREMFGNRPIREGRVTINLPPIAENGNSVAIEVLVDSPMTPASHVTRIGIFSTRDPVAFIAGFHFGPHNGVAQVATRIRLAGTQSLRAVAQMNDGSLWSGRASTYVTLAACIIG